MKTVIDYLTIDSADYKDRDFDEIVRIFLSKGWQPLGGASITNYLTTGRYLQTMVKYKQEATEDAVVAAANTPRE
jgi:predicted HD phosphohydrolase